MPNRAFTTSPFPGPHSCPPQESTVPRHAHRRRAPGQMVKTFPSVPRVLDIGNVFLSQLTDTHGGLRHRGPTLHFLDNTNGGLQKTANKLKCSTRRHARLFNPNRHKNPGQRCLVVCSRTPPPNASHLETTGVTVWVLQHPHSLCGSLDPFAVNGCCRRLQANEMP